ncbi:hypothetical protein ACFL1L_05430 [Thermoplasmatota archaeon]
MKKIIVIGISILSIFLLCSLSYQPITAEKPIIKQKEEVISVEDEDCGCKDSSIRRFPILCHILLPIALFYHYLITEYYDYNPPRIIIQQDAMFKAMAESWYCWWVWWPTE